MVVATPAFRLGSFVLVLIPALFGLVACAPSTDSANFSAETASGDASRTANSAGELPAEAANPIDTRRGEILSFACQACHSLNAGVPHQIGPNLNGMFGRAAGTAADFEYSDAMLNSGIVWSAENLDVWLQAPDSFLPGNNMAFAGYANPADRASLIAYLSKATTPPQ